jgi:threonine dehydrogenase-like Zn-dependent dehydrogenase
MREMSFLIPRNRQRVDVETVLRLMAEGKLPVDDLISRTLPPEECFSAYTELQDPNSGALTIAFQWNS